MGVKLQIEVAIVSYHGKRVFVRMMKKTKEYIVSVKVISNVQRNKLRGAVRHGQRNREAGGDGGDDVKEEHVSVAVDGLVPIGLALGDRNQKKTN